MPEDKKFAEQVKKDKEILEGNFESTLKKAEQTLKLFEEPVNLSQALNLERNTSFWNSARYINITSLDLKIIMKHLAFSIDEWEKRYFARQASLLIYESIEDIFALLGNEFKKVTEDFLKDNAFKENLKIIRMELNTFKQKHVEKLKRHRNISIAHRDKDTQSQLQTIYSISWLESINMCTAFDKILNQIGNFLERMMRKGITDGQVKFNAY